MLSYFYAIDKLKFEIKSLHYDDNYARVIPWQLSNFED